MTSLPPPYIPVENFLCWMFVDGGVIGRNGGLGGGTWAVRIIEEKTIHDAAGVIPNTAFGKRMPITNNISEMVALVMGLRRLPSTWMGIICSDSRLTIGRAMMGWKWTNIPVDLFREFGYQRNRLVNWDKCRFVNLSGHPTIEELKQGYSNRTGLPVSIHNVWCDSSCNWAAREFRAKGVASLEEIYDRTNESGLKSGWNEESAALPQNAGIADAK